MRTRMVARIAGSVLIALVISAGVVGASARPAVAAARCSGGQCVGHDPYAYGCLKGSHPTAYVYYLGVQVAQITNYYGYNCVSNWAEGHLTTAGVNMGGLGIYLQIFDNNSPHVQYMCYYNHSQSNQGWPQENCEGLYTSSVNAWTDMIDGNQTTCVQVVVYRYGNYVAASDRNAACQ